MLNVQRVHDHAARVLDLIFSDPKLSKLNGCELAAVLHSAAGTVDATTTAAAMTESYKKILAG